VRSLVRAGVRDIMVTIMSPIGVSLLKRSDGKWLPVVPSCIMWQPQAGYIPRSKGTSECWVFKDRLIDQR
jgi:hypothetical protein